jgi:hypothetical protein
MTGIRANILKEREEHIFGDFLDIEENYLIWCIKIVFINTLYPYMYHKGYKLPY